MFSPGHRLMNAWLSGRRWWEASRKKKTFLITSNGCGSSGKRRCSRWCWWRFLSFLTLEEAQCSFPSIHKWSTSSPRPALHPPEANESCKCRIYGHIFRPHKWSQYISSSRAKRPGCWLLSVLIICALKSFALVLWLSTVLRFSLAQPTAEADAKNFQLSAHKHD